MATLAVTEANFAEVVKRGIVLLDWWAAWCGPCRVFGPIFEQVSDKHPDVLFGKIDTEAEAALAAAFEIRSIPTLMALRDGILVFSQPGLVPGAALDELIKKVRALDMDDLRRKVAEIERGDGRSA